MSAYTERASPHKQEDENYINKHTVDKSIEQGEYFIA